MYVYFIEKDYSMISKCVVVDHTERWGRRNEKPPYLTEWSRPDRIVAYLFNGSWTCVHEKPATICKRKFWLEEYDMDKANDVINEYLKKKRRYYERFSNI